MVESLLFLIVTAGLPATGLAALTRALPWPATWKKRKPLSCATCLSGWASMPCAAFVRSQHDLPLAPTLGVWLGATAVSLYLLSKTTLFESPLFEEPIIPAEK